MNSRLTKELALMAVAGLAIYVVVAMPWNDYLITVAALTVWGTLRTKVTVMIFKEYEKTVPDFVPRGSIHLKEVRAAIAKALGRWEGAS